MRNGLKSAFTTVVLATLMTACSGPWIKSAPDEQIYTLMDIPMQNFHHDPESYLGTVIEDRFKYYRIYHDRTTYDPAKREQVIEGKTHFTARPVHQPLQVIQIQITPRQEHWMREMYIKRQDVVKARVRFAGIAPGDALAFDLLEILEPQRQ